MPKSFEEIFTENIPPHHDGTVKLKCIVHIPPPDSTNMLPPGLLLKSSKTTSEIFIQCEMFRMNNSNNSIENLQMVDLTEALKLLHEFRDDGKESGDFLFC